VLELVKQRSVVVQQEAMFGEMTVISIQKSKIKNQKSKLWSPDIVGT